MERRPRKIKRQTPAQEKVKYNSGTSVEAPVGSGNVPDSHPFGKNRRIEIRMGMTVNLGNYESQRIDLGFSGDIRDDEDMESRYDEIMNWVEDKLAVEVGLIKTAAPILDKIEKAARPNRLRPKHHI